MKVPIISIQFLLVMGAQIAEVRAADVRSWRNDGNGLYPSAQAETDWTAGSRVKWETPLPAHGNGCPILVGGKLFFTAESATLLCVDAATGKILWQKSNEYADLMEMAPGQPTPSVIGNRIFTAHGSEGQQGEAYAYEIPKTSAQLEKEGLKKIWHTQINKNRYYSSPLVHEGIVYLITREYQMQALEAATGDPIYSEKIVGFTGTAYTSLTLAGDVIFVGAEDGNAAFVKPGRQFAEISRTKVAPYRSTPIFDGGLTYLRTHEKLLAIHSK